MASIDPHLFFRLHETDYSDRLPCNSSAVQLIEISENEDRTTTFDHRILDSFQLKQWLEQMECPLEAKGQQESERPPNVLRLIVDHHSDPETKAQRPFEQLESINFPNDEIWHAQRGNVMSIPVSRLHFKDMVRQLRLPRSTAWLCQSSSLHFQTYNIDQDSTGITLRITNYGIMSMNIALSISHIRSARIINAVLLGMSPAQLDYMIPQIKELKDLALHPAFLPTLMYSYQRSMLQKLIEKERERLFQVEGIGGQSGVAIFNGRDDITGPSNHWGTIDGIGRDKTGAVDQRSLNNAALAVIQLVTSWERYTESLLLEVSTLMEFIGTGLAKSQGDANFKARGEILVERLRFVSQKGKEMLFIARYVKDRASAQISALYNFIGQKGNETSLDIALASKRDSTAMKSIAVLTMTFLPATFLATYFATPFIVSVNPSQDLYWAVTGPLTVTILIVWIVWDYWLAELDWTLRVARRLRLRLPGSHSKSDFEM